MRNFLNDKSLLKEAAPIAGEWIAAESMESFPVLNPAAGEEVGRLPLCTAAMTEKAIKAAYEAQRQWAKKTAKERGAVLRKWLDLTLANKEDLGRILTAEQGKPLAEAIGEIEYGASFIDWFAEEGRRAYGQTIPSPAANRRMAVIKQPVGVVAAITPWNFPHAMISRKAAPAFAAGCAMVLKPASETPFSAIAMAVLAERAGLPLALFSVVTGKSREIGPVLTGSELVRKLTFTGSTQVGAALYAQCAPTIKKISLELGGNAPFIVFDDADIAAAVKGLLAAKFYNNGQVCVCPNRVYVQDKIYDAFAAELADEAKKLKLGNGLEQGVNVGPLIDKAGLAKVAEHVQDAVAKGGKILLGGRQPALGGTFYEPTIITGMSDDMRIAREETFGPVAALFRFSDGEEAIRRANATEYGLAAYFYSRDIGRIIRVSEALEAGMVGVNTGSVSAAEGPFGGIKHSGLGREGSSFGLDEYMELKYVNIGEIL